MKEVGKVGADVLHVDLWERGEEGEAFMAEFAHEKG